MTKERVRFYLKNYPLLKAAKNADRDGVVIERYRSSIKVYFDDETNQMLEIVEDFMKSETNGIVMNVFENNYIKQKSDVSSSMRVPASVSSFYRIKSDVVDKCYHMAIARGLVSYEEILREKINR